MARANYHASTGGEAAGTPNETAMSLKNRVASRPQ